MTAIIGLGLVGAIVMSAVSSKVGTGSLSRHVVRASLSDLNLFRLGLLLVIVAFVALGSAVASAAPRAGLTWVLSAAGVWSLPLLLGAPLYSRDVWAYLGQGAVYAHGLDPYTHGPVTVPGPYARQVDPVWEHSGSPYGPVFLLVVRLIIALCGNHVVVAAAVVRLVSWLGLALLATSLVLLHRRMGSGGVRAAWLLVAGPLTLVLGLAGGHNDLLALGIVAFGLVLAARPGPVWTTLVPATVVITLGALVKAPGYVVVAFLPFVWLSCDGRGTQRLRWFRAKAVGLVAVITIVVTLLVGLVSGLGFGWVDRVNSRASGPADLTASESLALLWKYLHGQPQLLARTDAPFVSKIAFVSTAVVLVACWLVAARLGRSQLPVAIAVSAAVLLATSVQPWYFLWLFAAMALRRAVPRTTALLAALSVALTVGAEPSGRSLYDQPVGFTLMAITGAATYLVAWRAWQADPT